MIHIHMYINLCIYIYIWLLRYIYLPFDWSSFNFSSLKSPKVFIHGILRSVPSDPVISITTSPASPWVDAVELDVWNVFDGSSVGWRFSRIFQGSIFLKGHVCIIWSNPSIFRVSFQGSICVTAPSCSTPSLQPTSFLALCLTADGRHGGLHFAVAQNDVSHVLILSVYRPPPSQNTEKIDIFFFFSFDLQL